MVALVRGPRRRRPIFPSILSKIMRERRADVVTIENDSVTKDCNEA
jgi:hypothetical protein